MPRIIRKTRLLPVFVLLVSAFSAGAQNKAVTVKANEEPISTVLAKIEQQTGYFFVYNESDIDVKRKVSIDVVSTPTSKVLQELFSKDSALEWKLKGRNITITTRKTTSDKPKTKGGKRPVSGTVKDIQDGEPLTGAVVRVQGDNKNAVMVDIDGNFTINIDDSDGKTPVLEVSYIGYNHREVPIGDLSHVDINMTGSHNSLDEVIVVGSGTQKKVSVTGSITTVKGSELKMPTTTLSRAIGGRIAGVISRQTSGEPGTGSDFYIRGVSTFGGKATPLILLDDVEISASDLDFVPAENIESFTVLKDASATAIYGARGANGVMIITTKGGEFNTKTKINVNVEAAANFLSNAPDLIGGVDFMNMYNWVNEARNPGSAPIYSQDKIEGTASGKNPYLYPDVNWKKELFRNVAYRQRANLNVSGGGSKAKYYMSLDVQHENGLQNTNKLYSWDNNQKIYNYTFQNNISYKLTPTTDVSLNMNAQIRQKSNPDFSTETTFTWLGERCNPVDFPVFYPAGSDGSVRFGSGQVSTGVLLNPKSEINRTYYQENLSTVNTVVKVDQKLDFITKGLKINLWVNWKTYSKSYIQRAAHPYMYAYSGDYSVPDFDNLTILNPTASQFSTESGPTRQGDNTFEFQGNLNWTRKFGSHDLSAMVMYRMREYRGSKVLPNRNQGISGRITYDYDHRYLLEFNFGYNGTERLAKGYRFGFFPAASAGWVVSNEKFWEPISNWFTHLKVRGSIGLVGSDDLVGPNGTYFLYRDLIYQNNLNFWNWVSGDGDNSYTGSGPLIRAYALPDIGWEKSRKHDVGVDITLWGRFNLTAEYFRENRYDILMERASWPWALGYGMAIPWGNIGKALNEGFELSINWNKNITDDINISAQANVTYAHNKYVYKDEPNYKYPWQHITGQPLDNYRRNGYIADGLFKSQEEIDNSPEQQLGSGKVMVGDIKYRDLNGDGKINSDDQTLISKYGVNPRLMYGFGGTINWKKFDFGFFFTGSACRTITMQDKIDVHMNNYMQNTNIHRWTFEHAFNPAKGNFDAEYPLPGITDGDNSNNNQPSTYWLRNGDFLRLRSVELGWSFKYGRVYLTGLNLLCFSGFKVWDPELANPYKYPLQKTVNVGIQFNL